MIHYSPLRYPGGKNRIFPFFTEFLIENNLLGINYAEPFAGGAGLALRLLFEEYVNSIWINDYDLSIYAFWNSIVSQPEELCNWISQVKINIENWNYYRSVQNKKNNVPLLELAKSTLFLNRTNVSGIIKGGVIGGLNQTGNYKIDARFNKNKLISQIEKIANFSNRIKISNDDGIELIDKIEEKNNFFIYFDPPYFGKGSELYMNYYQQQDHILLAKRVKCISKGLWIISYDNNPFIHNIYSEYDKVVYDLAQNTSNRIGKELIIYPSNVQISRSLSSLKNSYHC